MSDDEKPDYGDTLEAQLIAEYVSGGMTLIDACRTLAIPLSTTYDRRKANPKFAAMLETAREIGFDVIANDCQAIADDTDNDYVEGVDRFGNPKIFFNKEHVQRSKLRIHTRMQLLAKWDYKRYGDKLQVEQKTASVAFPTSDDPIQAQKDYESLMKG